MSDTTTNDTPTAADIARQAHREACDRVHELGALRDSLAHEASQEAIDAVWANFAQRADWIAARATQAEALNALRAAYLAEHE